MNGSHLMREARRRARLTQEEVARRVGTTQSAIARIESGRHAPTLERVSDIAQACGFDVQIRLVPHDPHDWDLLALPRTLSPTERVERLETMVEFIADARAGLEPSVPGTNVTNPVDR